MTEVAAETTTVEGNGTDGAPVDTTQQPTGAEQGSETSTTESGFGGGDSGKQGGEAAAAVPETYELEIPEGVDDAFVGGIVDTAKELGLSNEAAQKLLNRSLESQKANTEGLQTYLDEMVKGWAKERDADQEYGGTKLQESFKTMNVALEKFGTPQLHAFMKENGLFDHPEMSRFFYRVGKAIGSDTDIAGGRNRGDVDSSKTPFEQKADKLYGNS